MTYSYGTGLLTSLIVTGVSSVWSFVLSQFPKLLSRFQRLSFSSALQSFYVNKLSFCWNHLATRFLNFPMFYVFDWHNFIWTSQFYCFECHKLTRTIPIYCPEWQGFIRTSQIYCPEWQGLPRTWHPCWLKTNLSKWLCFQTETQAIVNPHRHAGQYNSTHNQSIKLGKLQGRFSFYFWSKTEVVSTTEGFHSSKSTYWSRLRKSALLYSRSLGKSLKVFALPVRSST